jgi:hypothetical protein
LGHARLYAASMRKIRSARGERLGAVASASLRDLGPLTKWQEIVRLPAVFGAFL